MEKKKNAIRYVRSSLRSVIAFSVGAALFIGGTVLLAAPPTSKYAPGESLDPSCSPGDTNCGVLHLSVATSTGNFGIGTTSPYAKLSISGNGVFENYVYSSYFTATSTTASTFPYASTTALSVSGSFYNSSLTSGSVPFIGTGGLLSQNNANLFWDNTNTRLGIGTTSPYAKLSVVGETVSSYFTATTTTASTFPYASTTALTVSGTNGLTLGSLNGPLHANNGAVSATTSIGVLYGGTGAITFGQGWLHSSGGTSALTASTSPTVNYLTATSTTATSTFAGGALFATGGGNVGIGTTSPWARLDLDQGGLRVFGNVVTDPASDTLTFFGVGAGANNIVTGVGLEGQQNTFIGYNAGNASTNARRNTFVGYSAGKVNTTGLGNTYLGDSAGLSNVSGTSNVFVGADSGKANTGSSNVFIGSVAGINNTTGGENVFLGTSAGRNNITGSNSVFVGANSGFNNTGSQNIFIGDESGYNNTGTENIFFGSSSGYTNTTGSYNVFHGGSAGYSNTTGSYNVFQGYASGYLNTTGSYNVFQGYASGYLNRTGSANTIIGTEAGYGSLLPSNYASSTLVGYRAGYNLQTSGKKNILFGYQSGENITTGSNNIVIGYDIDAPSATSANTLNIGNLIFGTSLDGADTTLSTGNVGIGTTSPYAKLSVVGEAVASYFTATSTTATSTFMGAVGVGTTSPWRTLSVTGTASFAGLTGATGAGSVCLSSSNELVYNSASDACLPSLRETKHDIEKISFGGLSIIGNLNPVSFVYNSGNGRTRYGFIAEDIEIIDPQLATYSENGEISGIDDRALIALSVKAIQELDARISLFEANAGMADIVSGWSIDANGRLVVDEIQTNKLCVGATCVTEEQFLQMVRSSGAEAAAVTPVEVIEIIASTSSDAPTITSTTTMTEEIISPLITDEISTIANDAPEE